MQWPARVCMASEWLTPRVQTPESSSYSWTPSLISGTRPRAHPKIPPSHLWFHAEGVANGNARWRKWGRFSCVTVLNKDRTSVFTRPLAGDSSAWASSGCILVRWVGHAMSEARSSTQQRAPREGRPRLAARLPEPHSDMVTIISREAWWTSTMTSQAILFLLSLKPIIFLVINEPAVA